MSKFYYVDELKLNIKLEEIISFQLIDYSPSEFRSSVKTTLIVVKPTSVYKCDKKHYNNLVELLNK